jgi:hypothetical protein
VTPLVAPVETTSRIKYTQTDCCSKLDTDHEDDVDTVPDPVTEAPTLVPRLMVAPLVEKYGASPDSA